MTTQIQIFKTKEHGQVRGYADINGTVHINVTDIGNGLGFVNKKGKIRLNTINKLLKRFNYNVEVNGNDYIPENMFYRLAMKADNEAANNFQAYLADEVIPSIRKTGFYSINRNSALPPAPVNSIRQENISTRKSFTSVLQLFIFYARTQGDTRQGDKIYGKFTTLANQFAGIPKGGRTSATDKQKLLCIQAENLMGNIFLKGMQAEKHFSTIECEVILSMQQFSKYTEPTLPLLE